MQLCLICVTFILYSLGMEKNINNKSKKFLLEKLSYINKWWIGTALILFFAIAIWCGFHAHYRFISIALLMPAIAIPFLKKIWHWITCITLMLIVIFLWLMGPSGYRYASLIPIVIIVLLLSAIYLKNVIKKIILFSAAFILLVTGVVEIPILVSAKDDSECDMKYIIVLGAAVYGTEPSISLKNRLDAAVAYLRENTDTVVIVSGGQGSGEDISEAECMYRYLIHKGIEKDRIIMESDSTSTMENLVFSKALIEKGGEQVDLIGIVSSSYHLYRAKKMAESVGVKAYGIPCEDGYPVYMIGMYIREAIAVMKLWTFGTIERDSCMAAVYSLPRV